MIKRLLFLMICCMAVGVVADDGTYFASLRRNEVNWRSGPGERYPIKWIYQEQGYPVKVLDTYDVWRQVTEADGSVGWVHRNMLSNRRTVLVQEEGNLVTKPDVGARVVAVVQPGTIGRIARCPADVGYCLLAFSYEGKDVKGWFPRRFVWGVMPDEEIE